jgi:hypothetical protein
LATSNDFNVVEVAGHGKTLKSNWLGDNFSKLLAHKESRGDMQGAALVKQVSPVAWQHVNLYGRYEFRKQPEPDVDEIARNWLKSGSEPRPLWRRCLKYLMTDSTISHSLLHARPSCGPD